MSWMECNKMDEKLKFIARYLEGEKIAPLCREFGVSRTTGHKLIERYKMMGQMALVEQKRTPHRYGIWVVSFLNYDLGYFDEQSKRVEPVEDPFGLLKV